MPPAPVSGQLAVVKFCMRSDASRTWSNPMMNAPVVPLQGRYSPTVTHPASGPEVAIEAVRPGSLSGKQRVFRAITVVAAPVIMHGFRVWPLTVQVPS